jgi:hypothetical protein
VEIVRVLAVLWRRRIAVAAGLLAVVAVAVKTGGAGPTSSGVASTRVALDTPKSQVVESLPQGVASLPWRASLLTHLAADAAFTAEVEARLGIAAGRLAVVDPSLVAPAVAASLPKAAADVAARQTAPYVLTVSMPNPTLPIVSLGAQAPDRSGAARLAAAAAAVLESRGSSDGGPGRQAFVVERIAAIHWTAVASGNGRIKSVVVAAVLFGLWCAGVALAPLLVHGLHVAAATSRPRL